MIRLVIACERKKMYKPKSGGAHHCMDAPKVERVWRSDPEGLQHRLGRHGLAETVHNCAWPWMGLQVAGLSEHATLML
jgi:hypothetical protein